MKTALRKTKRKAVYMQNKNIKNCNQHMNENLKEIKT